MANEATVVLVNPPSVDYAADEKPVKGLISPLGLGYVGTDLRRNGFDVELIDAETMRLGFAQVAQAVASLHPRVVGITVLSPVVPSAAQIAALIKSNDPSCYVVIGGVGATAEPEELLDLYPQIDVVVVGEGEGKISRLVSNLVTSGLDDLSSVEDLVFRQEGHVIRSQATPRLMNIDQLPSLDRSLFACDPNNKTNSVESFMITSRGCPSSCNYCAIPATWRYARYRSAELVVQEMAELHQKYGVNDFHFVDDTFTAHKRRILEICQLIEDQSLHIGWRCTTRCDRVDRDMLGKMRDAGCYMVTFGVEVGDNERLSEIGKRTDLETIFDRVSAARDLGILVKCMYMLGFPNETLLQMQRTIDVAIDLGSNFAYFSPTKAYPGTMLYQELRHRYPREQLMSFDRMDLDPSTFNRDEGTIHQELCSLGFDVTKYFKYNEYHDATVLPSCSQTEFLSMVSTAYRRFYLRPEFVTNWRSIMDTKYA